MKHCIIFFISFILVSATIQAQLINGNAFLQGQYVEVGMNQCGGWGTTANAPAGYHARSGILIWEPTDNQQNLGFVADPDKDGWNVGFPNKYNGDYFLPKAPFVGWGLSFNGNNYGTDRTYSSNVNCSGLDTFVRTGITYPPFSGNIISVTNNGMQAQAIWQGNNNGLQLTKIVTVKSTALYFTIQVELKNTSVSPINNIYYGEYVNPDNDYYSSDVATGNVSTQNFITYQNPTDQRALVEAFGAINQTYLGLGSKDCRSIVFRGIAGGGAANNNSQTTAGNVIDWYNADLTSSVSTAGSDAIAANLSIGIAFKIGVLAPNDSTSFLYTYILKQADFNAALAETAPTIINNDTAYLSGDTIYRCANTTQNLTIQNGDFNNWNWSNVPGINTTTGISVTQTVGTTPVTDTAFGVGPCGSDTIILTIVPIVVATPVMSSNSPVCAGQNITVNVTPITGATAYNWTGPAGFTGAGLNQVIPASSSADSGEYFVTAFIGSCNSPLDSTVVAVNQSVIPSVSIAASSNNICQGTSITFTATPTNGGSTPSYQWQLNGTNVGTNSNNYVNSSLVNGDNVICVVTNNANCATSSTATSNTITMVVNSSVIPSVSIAASSNNICPGTSITFIATPVNGGNAPSYQWQLNGANVGTNSTTYSNNNLVNGDKIICTLTSNANCASPLSATSNLITMAINSIVIPSVSIAASSNNICQGTSVTFTATPTNGGNTPSYQWQLNGTNVGTNSDTYLNSSLVNGDQVICVLTSNANCASPLSASSNSIQMIVFSPLIPTISINASANNICQGNSINFNATSTNAGVSAFYQWQLNGVNVGSNSTSYVNNTLVNNDSIKCILTSTVCSNNFNVTSNSIGMIIQPAVTASVNISASQNPICVGTQVSFNASSINGGSAPLYEWEVNGNVAGSGDHFISNGLVNGDIVRCQLTSNMRCVSPPLSSDQITMIVNSFPTVSFLPDTVLLSKANPTVQLNPVITGNILNYNWIPEAGLSDPTIAMPVAKPTKNITYQLQVTSNAGCTASGSIIVKVIYPLLIPNSFTPNGDGLNDIFRIPPEVEISLTNFSIYDRWGNEVFSTSNVNMGWDGNIHGVPAENGTYLYFIKGSDIFGKPVFLKGTVLLIR